MADSRPIQTTGGTSSVTRGPQPLRMNGSASPVEHTHQGDQRVTDQVAGEFAGLPIEEFLHQLRPGCRPATEVDTATTIRVGGTATDGPLTTALRFEMASHRWMDSDLNHDAMRALDVVRASERQQDDGRARVFATVVRGLVMRDARRTY